MSIDPAIFLAIQSLLILIVGASLLHKLYDFRAFVSAVEDYQVLPRRLAQICAALLVVAELCILVGLIAAPARFGAIAGAGLFAFYGLVIAYSIHQGRTEISCGCSWVRTARLSPFYLFRNSVLILIALTLTVPTGTRALIWVDVVNAAFFALTMAGLYSLVDALPSIRDLRRIAR